MENAESDVGCVEVNVAFSAVELLDKFALILETVSYIFTTDLQCCLLCVLFSIFVFSCIANSTEVI